MQTFGDLRIFTWTALAPPNSTDACVCVFAGDACDPHPIPQDTTTATATQYCHILLHHTTATNYCNILQHTTAMHCNTLLQRTAALHCNTLLQHNTPHYCNTLLQYTATHHCNTLQHTTATHYLVEVSGLGVIKGGKKREKKRKSREGPCNSKGYT